MPPLAARYVLWLVLALPSIPMMALLTGMTERAPGWPIAEELLHPTGEFAARFMIIAMMLSPLALLFPGARFIRWLLSERRAFGVAAFLYAVAHTVLYVVDMNSLQAMLGEFLAIGIWTGWLAMVIFLPLGLSSNEYSLRRLGRGWKMVQRGAYPAAVATLFHWIYVHNGLGPALVHFAPLAALELYRLWRLAAERSDRPRKETPA